MSLAEPPPVVVFDRDDLSVSVEDAKTLAAETLDAAVEAGPSLVVVGRMDSGPVRWCRRVGDRLPDVPVVAVVDDPIAVNDALDAGAAVALLREDPALCERLAAQVDRLIDRAYDETALGHVDAATWVADAELTDIHYLSPQYTEIFGYPTELLEDDAWADAKFIHPDDRDRAVATFECWAAGRFPTAQYRVIHPTGDVRWVLERANHATAPGGRTVIVGYAVDVTALKRIEVALRAQNERLEQFAGIVSHDLRNPLATAQGWLEVAQADEGPVDAADAHARIERALHRANEIVGSLLDLARTDDATRETTDVEAVTREAWELLDTTDATLSTSSLPPVLADEALLRNLFENLFRNSLEHGRDADATLTVTVGRLETHDPGGEADAVDGDDLAGTDGFFVADDGVGIPPSERERLFEFGHSSGNGTGLGLGIVDRIVRVHGWSIDVVESDAGGARFEVTGVEWCSED